MGFVQVLLNLIQSAMQAYFWGLRAELSFTFYTAAIVDEEL